MSDIKLPLPTEEPTYSDYQWFAVYSVIRRQSGGHVYCTEVVHYVYAPDVKSAATVHHNWKIEPVKKLFSLSEGELKREQQEEVHKVALAAGIACEVLPPLPECRMVPYVVRCDHHSFGSSEVVVLADTAEAAKICAQRHIDKFEEEHISCISAYPLTSMLTMMPSLAAIRAIRDEERRLTEFRLEVNRLRRLIEDMKSNPTPKPK